MIVAKQTNDWLDLLQLPDFNWWQFLFATACLMVLIWSIVRFVSRVHEDVDPAESDQDMLIAISELRRQGDLSEDEYRSIKGQLLTRMSTSFRNSSKEILSNTEVGQPAGELVPDLSPKEGIGEEDSNVSGSGKSKSVQSTTSSSLTEDPEPLNDTANKTTGSVAPGTENGEGI